MRAFFSRLDIVWLSVRDSGFAWVVLGLVVFVCVVKLLGAIRKEVCGGGF